MIRVSVLYPNNDGATFDHSYYTQKHLPMVEGRLKPMGLLGVQADRGLGSAAPGSPAPFVVMFYMTFESVEAFEKAFGAHAEEIMGDIPNYTNIEPVIQISEITVGATA